MRLVLVTLLLAAGLLLWTRRSALESGVLPASGVAVSPAEEFRRIGDELYAGQCPQYGRGARETFEAQLDDPAIPNGKRLPLQLDLATEYVEAGEVTRAIELLEQSLELAQKSNNARQQRKVVNQLAQAWLREA